MTPPEPSALQRLRRLEREGAAAEGAPDAPARRSGRGRGVLAVTVGGLLVLLSKGKALLWLLLGKGALLLSALKLGKLGATFATMGASLLYYTRAYPFSFALGFLLLILLHEMGHGLAAKRLGLRVGAPVFIPGFGALIALADQPRSTWMNAVVGYGGPLAGTLGGLGVLLLGPVLAGPGRAEFCLALAHLTFLINFFNLLPIGGLDGDRITEPLTAPVWAAGLTSMLLVTGLTLSHPTSADAPTDPQTLFAVAILLLGAVKGVRAHRRSARSLAGDGGRLVDRITGPRAGYTEEASVTPSQRRLAAVGYFGLAGILAVLLQVSRLPAP